MHTDLGRKPMRLAFAALAFSLAAAPALGLEVRECDWAASVQTIAEPWEKNTKSFYRGQVRVALIDTGGEPVCCSAQLLILIPDRAEGAGGRVCRLVGDTGTMGYESIDFARLTTRYDAGRGLLIAFAFTRYVDGLTHTNGVGRVRVNVERQTITKE
jgi:hypothetical protein